MSSQLYPEVIDASTLGPRYSTPLYMPIGVEGQAAASGDAVVARIYQINRPSEAELRFGTASSLTELVKFLLGRGVAPVLAVCSVKSDTLPTDEERQAAWANLESDINVRIRMTDSTDQAVLGLLADSCENAEKIYNKQIAFGGLASGTDKSVVMSAAGALSSKRMILIAPGVYDNSAVLLSGNFAAAAVAAAVSLNNDISDDLDTMVLQNLTGIELDATGMPLFRKRILSGTAVNDFEDVLQAGASPLQNNRQGNGVQITHLRTTYVTDTTFDALMTRLIVDQVFIDVRDYCQDNNYLRRGNTASTRADLQAAIEGLLAQRSAWISPVTTPDGTLGYNVAVTSSTDGRAVYVSYEGIVVRGIQTINVDARLSVPV